MVVTRRTPAPPAPTSRTHSAQPIPRLAKKAHQDSHSVPDKPSPLSNGSAPDPAAPLAAGEVDKAVSASTNALCHYICARAARLWIRVGVSGRPPRGSSLITFRPPLHSLFPAAAVAVATVARCAS
ncbi:hypothetical protein GY45DRAFT_597784 [Cubamyces sp. BRFM 1775]|nr:hypothetical protein GY45DRAFT_597784 [Cubamyces sp. BRFM 1775]